MSATTRGLVPRRSGVRRLESAMVGVLGATVLLTGLGVTLRIPLLATWFPTLPPMQPLVWLAILAVFIALATHRRSIALPIAGITLGSAALAISLVARISRWTELPAKWLWTAPGVTPRLWYPPLPTTVGLLGATLGIALLVADQPRYAQICTLAPAMLGTLSLLAFLYGDRASTVAASAFPGTATSLPAAVAMLAAAVGVMAASDDTGVTAWILVDSPGRRTMRRLLPVVLAVPLLLAGMARWARLETQIGEARTWAAVMWAFAVGICAVAVAAVGLVDRLAGVAKRAELLELRAGVAQRSEQVAALATALAGTLTVEEVSQIVNHQGIRPVDARSASVGLIDERLKILRVHHSASAEEAVRRKYADPALEAPLVLTDAARLNRAIFIADHDDYVAHYPGTKPAPSLDGGGARAALPLRDRSERAFGSLAFSWDEPVHFDEVMRSTLTTMAALVARSLERAELADAISQDLLRSHELARLAEVLAGTSSVTAVMEFIAEQVNSTMDAAVAFVGTLDDTHTRLHRHFPAGLPERSVQDFLEQSVDQPLPITDAILSDCDVLIDSRDDLARRYPASLEAYEITALESSAYLPLRGREGNVLGALGIAWDHPVDFNGHLVALLRTIANLVAQTLERVWLIDARLHEAQRTGRMAQLSQRLVTASTQPEIVEIVREHLAATMWAMISYLTILDETGSTLTIHHPSGPETVHRLDDRRPEAFAVRHRSMVRIVDADDARRRFPVFARTAPPEVAGFVVQPVLAADGSALGSLCIGWSDALTLDDAGLAQLSTVTDLVSQTLERIGLAEAEHELVVQLQRRILRPIPPLGSLHVATRYQPASAWVGMGGDWFEGIRLDNDARLALVVGDVVGHGVDAAADMAHLRSAVGLLMRMGTPLEELFERVTDAIDIPSIMATVAVMVIDPAHDSLRYACAGHPPPLLVRPDREVVLLDGGRHPLLGTPSRRCEPATEAFAPGSLLVAYTDGLIEARRESVDVGIGRLVEATEATHDRDLEARADELLQRCTEPDITRDDIALVLVEAGRSSV